jgi:hypothetical protein
LLERKIERRENTKTHPHQYSLSPEECAHGQSPALWLLRFGGLIQMKSNGIKMFRVFVISPQKRNASKRAD